MAESKMKEVAKLLGLELEEEFRIKYDNKAMYVLKEDGFFEVVGRNTYLQRDIDNLLNGEWEVVKLPKPILDEKEKKYLSAVIKPFRKHIINIRKIDYYEYEYIEICIYRYDDGVSFETLTFPYYNKGEMYKGMKYGKEYTLEELGL